ncbi:hypothetical protein BDZ97DRAFT_1796665 [Flammula alnicola]|nr:hypothetical protein BDZ97DRAFT_1796665 [Flammula alnicola]
MNTSLPNSLFRVPIIQQVFNHNWFGDGTFSRGSYFAGETQVPLVTVALVMTAVSLSVHLSLPDANLSQG